MLITSGHCGNVVAFKLDYEVADATLMLHVAHASREHSRIVVQSLDTAVVVLCNAHYSTYWCRELWFRSGVQDKLMYIHVHSLAHEIGPRMCNVLIRFHVLTGCDSNSALSGLGKKRVSMCYIRAKSINTLSFGQLGAATGISNHTSEACQSFICAVYTAVTMAGTKVNDIRYCMFCQKGN